MTGDHLGKAILCLSCANYVVMPEFYEDDIVKIPISVEHRCIKDLTPKEGKDGQGNVVSDYCEDFIVRKK